MSPGEEQVSPGLAAARSGLAGSAAWLVGGAIRDRLLGRLTADIDVAVEGDPREAARAVARAGGRAACFSMSDEFGSWRVVARDRSWQVDVQPLQGHSLEEDLALRDFTVNAIAQPIGGGDLIDPLGGARDLRSGILRTASPRAFERDPLRVLRLVRVAIEIGLEPDDQAAEGAARIAPALSGVSAERVFGELRRILAADDARAGLEMMAALGATAVVLPELEALRGVQQNRFHDLDVHDHTLAVLERTIELERCSGPYAAELIAVMGDHRPAVRSLLAEPLADEMSRGEALRWGALLHDAAKPLTRAVTADGAHVTFMGHDVRGAESRTRGARTAASE